MPPSSATLARATRSGAGYIYTKALVSTETDKAKNLVVCGDLNSCTGKTPLLPGLTSANVNVTQSTVGTDRFVTVQIVNFSHVPIFDLEKIADLFATSSGTVWNSNATQVRAATTMRYVGDR